MPEPVLRRSAGIWNALVYAACPSCDWRGRSRSVAGTRCAEPREIEAITRGESIAHQVKKHSRSSERGSS